MSSADELPSTQAAAALTTGADERLGKGDPGGQPEHDGEGDDTQQCLTSQGHPTSVLDETVHQRHRLGILTITAEAKSAEFGYLREALGLTPGNLSRHLTVLEEAGLVQVDKGYAGRRPRTWVRITSQGRAALAAELAALTELLRRHATLAQK
jgi:DNA-binding MarR family transcriptional regulator